MELREKVARAIFFRAGEQDDTHWQHVQPYHREIAYEQADAILAIPEIAEALEAKRIEGDTIRKAWREGYDSRLGHER